MRLSLGFDPGPKRTAWALSSSVKGKTHFDKWGMVDSNPNDIWYILDAYREVSPVVVVEQIFLTGHGNNNTIRDTCQVAGGIAWMAEFMEFKVVLTTSTKWRRSICFGHKGQATPGDKDVALALFAIYGKSLPHRSNTHLRDALGVSTYGVLL